MRTQFETDELDRTDMASYLGPSYLTPNQVSNLKQILEARNEIPEYLDLRKKERIDDPGRYLEVVEPYSINTSFRVGEDLCTVLEHDHTGKATGSTIEAGEEKKSSAILLTKVCLLKSSL